MKCEIDDLRIIKSSTVADVGLCHHTAYIQNLLYKNFPISFYTYFLLGKFRKQNPEEKNISYTTKCSYGLNYLITSLKHLTLGWRDGSAVEKHLFLQGWVSNTHTAAHNIQSPFLASLATKCMYAAHTFNHALKHIGRNPKHLYL